MTHPVRRGVPGCILGSLCWLGFLAGCGGEEAPLPVVTPGESKATSAAAAGPSGESKLPTASINGNVPPAPDAGGPDGDEKIEISELAPGSAEWLVREIMKVRIRPLPETDDVNKQRTARQERNHEIIDLATKAIGLTHAPALADPQQERVFNVAVHQLMDAHLQLALQGDSESIDLLYEHADALYQRKANSEAAMDAGYTVARFAHANAQRFADREPRWIEEFTRQALLFAQRFPQPDHQNRAMSLLFSAGQSCELQGKNEGAIACYTAIRDKYPDSPQSRLVVSFLRRLSLEGEALQFAGPTIEGGFVNIDQYRGRPVLIAFWSSDARQFHDDLPQLNAIADRYQPAGFQIIGVNLNENEPDVDAFLEQQPLSWPQVFFADPERRGWSNPIAVYYGVRSIPTYWLVAPDGTVLSTQVDLKQLDAQLRTLLTRPATP